MRRYHNSSSVSHFVFSSLNQYALSERRLYTPNMVWIELQEIDWDAVPGVLQLKPQDIDLVGNVLCDFETLDGEDPDLPACGDEGDDDDYYDDEGDDDDDVTTTEPTSALRGAATE